MPDNTFSYSSNSARVQKTFFGAMTPDINVMLYQQLGRIGNNINQIAYALNYALKVGHPIADDIDDPRSAIESIRPLLLEVQQQLMGIDAVKDQEPEE